MRFQPWIPGATALASSLVVIGLLSGCGDSSDNAAEVPNGATGASALTTGSTGNTGSKDSEGNPTSKQDGQGNAKDENSGSGDSKKTTDRKKSRGHEPESARDKRGKAPDDAISDRPGGPRPSPSP